MYAHDVIEREMLIEVRSYVVLFVLIHLQTHDKQCGL